MDKQLYSMYEKITQGAMPVDYRGPEEEGKRIRRCTILKGVNLEYRNSTSFSREAKASSEQIAHRSKSED